MVHCDPAPPHPPPGQIYNTICIDWQLTLGVVLVGLLLVVLLQWLSKRP